MSEGHLMGFHDPEDLAGLLCSRLTQAVGRPREWVPTWGAGTQRLNQDQAVLGPPQVTFHYPLMALCLKPPKAIAEGTDSTHPSPQDSHPPVPSFTPTRDVNP